MLRRCERGSPTVDPAVARSNLTDGFGPCPPTLAGPYKERASTPTVETAGERSFGVCGNDEDVVAEPEEAEDRSRDADWESGDGSADDWVVSVTEEGAVEVSVAKEGSVGADGFETERFWYGTRCGAGGSIGEPALDGDAAAWEIVIDVEKLSVDMLRRFDPRRARGATPSGASENRFCCELVEGGGP